MTGSGRRVCARICCWSCCRRRCSCRVRRACRRSTATSRAISQATTQMFETGNFVDIRFQDQPRYLQPAGIYWLQAASVALFSEPGEREVWAHRIPSLVGATAAVLLTAWIGNLLFGAPAGFVAAVLLAASVLLGVEARMAKIDAVLLAAILTAQAALARIYLASAAGREAPRALGRAAVAGVRRRADAEGADHSAGRARHGAAAVDHRAHVGMAAAVAAGLGRAADARGRVAVVDRDRDRQRRRRSSRSRSGKSLLGKVATGQQSHGAPPGYYLAAFPLTFWPGSLFAALAVPFAWARRREPAVRFCLCWIAPTWLVFELVATKLPHYVLPTYPAIACLDGGRTARAGDEGGRALGRRTDAGLCRLVAARRRRAGRAAAARRLGARSAHRSGRHLDRARGRYRCWSDAAVARTRTADARRFCVAPARR